jgi:hypothetical protein
MIFFRETNSTKVNGTSRLSDLGDGGQLPPRVQPPLQLFTKQLEIHRFGNAGVATCL